MDRPIELEDVNGDDLADLVVNTPGGVVVLWQIFGDFMSAQPDRLVTQPTRRDRGGGR